VPFGVVPFGLTTGVAMVAGGIPPHATVTMSLLVFAGASMLAATQLLADNSYALRIARFTEHPRMSGKLWYYLGAAGSGLPVSWKLEFAAPLAFIAISVPLLRDRGMAARPI
jgi:predicted branched-subunit amino acid permease